MLLMLVPGYLAFSRRRREAIADDGLEAIRQIWMAFTGATVLFGVVILFTVPGSETSPAGPWLALLGAVGIVCMSGVRLVGGRPLNCSDSESLAASYRQRFFLRTALSEAVALVAFVATFIVGQAWLYWLALPIALLGYAWNAPTSAHLRSDQHQLALSGCAISLVSALRTGSPRRK